MSTGRYAERTEVSSEKSRMEIERTLVRYGASRFMYGWEDTKAIIGFQMNNRHIRFILPLPDKAEFKYSPTRYKNRTEKAQHDAWEQACRQRWRALGLTIKAKLEACECGITEFESEFLAHIVLPNGQTYGDFAKPQIQKAYESGNMPPLLTFGGDQ